MVDSQVIAFIFVAMLVLTPSPDTMLVVRNVVQGGRHDGIVTTCGICVGLFVHATLSALGVSVILMHSATAFHLVQYAGACLWLGSQSLRSAVPGVAPPTGPMLRGTPGGIARQHCFLEGFLSNVLNPKVAVFYLAFLSQFIGPMDPVLQKSLLLTGIHYVEAMVWLVAVATVVEQVRRFFLHSTVRRWRDGVCGALFVGFGVRLALDRQ